MTEPGYIYQETTGAPLKMWAKGVPVEALKGIEGKRPHIGGLVSCKRAHKRLTTKQILLRLLARSIPPDTN